VLDFDALVSGLFQSSNDISFLTSFQAQPHLLFVVLARVASLDLLHHHAVRVESQMVEMEVIAILPRHR